MAVAGALHVSTGTQGTRPTRSWVECGRDVAGGGGWEGYRANGGYLLRAHSYPQYCFKYKSSGTEMKQVLQKPGMDPAFTAESSQLYTNDNACGPRLAGIQRALHGAECTLDLDLNQWTGISRTRPTPNRT